MSRINRNNYESYVVDYLDGKLEHSLKDELLYFLGDHPDLQQEVDGFRELVLEPVEEQFFEKQALKRIPPDANQIAEQEFDLFCIAAREGDLLSDQKKLLQEQIDQNSERARLHQLYGMLALIPDQTLVYREKQQLKKFVSAASVRSMVYAAMAVAASLLLFFSGYYYLSRDVSMSAVEVAVANLPEQEAQQEDRIALQDVSKIVAVTPENKTPISQQPEPQTTNENTPEVDVYEEQLVPRFSYEPARLVKQTAVRVQSDFQTTLLVADLLQPVGDMDTRVFGTPDAKAKITGWDIAFFGIQAVNQITGVTVVEVEKQYDEQEKVSSLAVKSTILSGKKQEKDDN